MSRFEVCPTRSLDEVSPPRSALAVALPGWLVARGVVLGTLALAHYVVDHLHPSTPGAAARVHQGLLGWDAGFYQAIAAHGYAGQAREALRFFPLVPMLAKVAGWLPGMSPGKGLLVVSNAAALAASALLVRLARTETGDEGLAGRAAWLLALAPPAFVLVMGYSEGLFLALGVGEFLALRRRRWGWAVVLGILAGLTRPLGVLLVAPAAVEAVRGLSRAKGKERAARVASVLAPLAGTGAYLAWVGAVYGDWLAPLRIQAGSTLHGSFSNPIRTLSHNLSDLLHGHHVGSGLHVPWILLLAVLGIVSFWRLPASYGVYALLTLAAGLSSANLDSVERYALGAFPFVLVAAGLTASRRVERAVLSLSAAAMGAYALLAFLNSLVP
jgi:hypothetical protein